MNPTPNPAATDHLPIFITAPGSTDVVMVVTGLFLLGAVLLLGVLFFWLHSLPERIAHKSQKFQLEIVALLCLISLFTHEHAFWIAALILAFIEFPDFSGWLARMVGAVERIAGHKREPGRSEIVVPPSSETATTVAVESKRAGEQPKELTHA